MTPLGLLRSNGVDLQFLVRHFAKEKQHGGERLLLRASGDSVIDGQVSEKGVVFIVVQFSRIALATGSVAMEADEVFHPRGRPPRRRSLTFHHDCVERRRRSNGGYPAASQSIISYPTGLLRTFRTALPRSESPCESPLA